MTKSKAKTEAKADAKPDAKADTKTYAMEPDLSMADMPDLKSHVEKPEPEKADTDDGTDDALAAKIAQVEAAGREDFATEKLAMAEQEVAGHIVDNHDEKSVNIPNAPVIGLSYGVEPDKEFTTHQMTFGCHPSQLTRHKEGTFTDMRITRKWFDALDEGDEIEVRQKNGDDPYAVLRVVKKELIALSFRTALDAVSRTHHFVKTGQSVAALEELYRSIYPEKAFLKAAEDGDGFTVLELELVKEIKAAEEAA